MGSLIWTSNIQVCESSILQKFQINITLRFISRVKIETFYMFDH